MNGWRVPPHVLVATALAVVTGLGWWRHSTPLALVGVAGVLAAAGMALWQRHCLTGVTYRRRLAHGRAMFGEQVALETEIVNDKLLPLTWLRVEDNVPRVLSFQGATVVSGRSDLYRSMVQVLPLLPYQRVRRRIVIECDHRGLHLIGPAELTSGDPVGYRHRSSRVHDQLELIVYPKIFALAPPAIASRLPLGPQVTRTLLGDPSRVVGVREYRPGDRLRHVDWRASARTTTLLVREHEPTTSARVVVFGDVGLPRGGGGRSDTSVLEFTVAVTASIVAELDGRGIGVGLRTTGSVRGVTAGQGPRPAPSALADMLDHLARVTPYGGPSLTGLLVAEGSRLPTTTSVVVVAADFPEDVLVAVAGLRRRTRVSALWVDAGHGSAPPELFDARLRAVHTDDWREHDVLELAS